MPPNIKQAIHNAIIKYELNKVDAYAILSHIISQPKEYLICHDDAILYEDDYAEFEHLCDKRQSGIPLAYLVEFKEFYSLPFKVNPHVLIPRADTEVLVEFAIKHASKNGLLFDLGTGSGAIAVSLATHRKDLSIVAIDVSKDALLIAEDNAKLNHVQEYIKFTLSSWLDDIEDIANANNKTYLNRINIIVSNPPYIDSKDNLLHDSSIKYEPMLALTDGQDGLSHIRYIIKQSYRFLMSNASSYLVIEHGYDQAYQVAQIFKDNDYINIGNQKDLAGHTRITYAQKP
jgi:release factor glutamine methyltransferase